eukprot:scaffold79173_cov20-Prasinocladus_malaysianus.AAC.1
MSGNSLETLGCHDIQRIARCMGHIYIRSSHLRLPFSNHSIQYNAAICLQSNRHGKSDMAKCSIHATWQTQTARYSSLRRQLDSCERKHSNDILKPPTDSLAADDDDQVASTIPAASRKGLLQAIIQSLAILCDLLDNLSLLT